MEQKLVQLHRQSLNYSNVLYMPYKAYNTLVRHLGLLDSRKLWSKLVKYLSIVRKAPIQEVIESFIASQDVRTLEGIETKWALMNLLFFMVVTWVRLGKHHYSRVSNDQTKSIRVSLALTGGRQKSELNLLIQSSFKLQKEQFSRQLHKTIIGECQKYKLHFQVDLVQQKYQIFSQEQLMYDQIVLPSVMQISGVRFELHSKLFIRRHKQTQIKDCLNLKQYTTILKAFRNIDGIKYDKTIYTFLYKFIKEIGKKLLSLQKQHKYYFIITPKDILIYDKGKDIRVQIDLKHQECYFHDQKMLPDNYLNNIYTDRKLDTQKLLDKTDFWSVGLCLLSITSRFQDIDTFQKMLLRARKKDQLHTFVREEIDRVEVERQFDPEVVVRALKEWLRYEEIRKEEITNQEKKKIDEYFDKKVIQTQFLKDDKDTNINWLQGILVHPERDNTDTQTQVQKQHKAQKTSEKTTEKFQKPEEKSSQYQNIQTNTQKTEEQIPAENQIRKVQAEQKVDINVEEQVERKDATPAIEKVQQKEQIKGVQQKAAIEQPEGQKQQEQKQQIMQPKPIQREEPKPEPQPQPQPQPQPSVPAKFFQATQPPQTQKQKKKSGQEQHTDTVPIPLPKQGDKEQPHKQNAQLNAVVPQTGEQAGAVKNVEFIRSISSNTKTSGQVNYNGNQTKNFSVYSKNPNEKEEEVPFSNREKVVTINGKDIKIDLNYNQNQKLSSIKRTWRDTQRFIVDKQAFYSKTQDKMKKVPFQKLTRQEKKCNLVAPQVDPKHIAQIHKILVDDDQIFIKMGYLSADTRRSKEAVCQCDSVADKENKGKGEDINGILNKLQGEEEQVTIQIQPEEEIPQRQVFYNSCSHGQCTNCFKKFFDQKFQSQQFENIECFQKNCNQKLSLQIFKNLIKDSQKRIKNRHLSKYLVNDYLKKNSHELILNSQYIRCRKKQCEGELDFHVIENGNKIFFCESCRDFICIHCFNPYHGSVACKDYPQAEESFSILRQNMASIPRIDSLQKKVNRTSLRKLLKEANLGQPIAVDQMRAMLLMGEVFKLTRKRQFHDVILGDKDQSLAVEGVIESLKEYLHTLHTSIRNMGNLTDLQIRQVAKNNNIITDNLHKIYIHKDAYLDIFCNL